jgi:hypothetical protein
MTPTRCKATKADGTRCAARPLTGSDFCFFHDPQASAARTAARKAGGQERSRRAAVLPVDTPALPLASVGDVVGLLATTINEVRRGELDPKVSNAIGYLAGLLLRALEQGDLEARLAALETVIRQQDPRVGSLPNPETFIFENPAA